MSRVVGVAKVAFSVGQATFTNVSTSSDGMHVCINNKTASLATIQEMVHTLIRESKDLLSTMNIDYNALSGTHCRDEIAMLSIAASGNHFDYARLGYNIFHGEHFNMKEECLLKIGRWFGRDGNPNKPAMLEFLKQSAMFQERLFVILHLTAGSPSRGAEMTRWRWQTTPEGPSCMRFDGVKRLIFMLFQSTKTSRAAQKDKFLIKYLGEELTRLFVAFSFIRRLEILFSLSMDLPAITIERLQSYIFVVHGLPLSPLDYSQILRKIASRFTLPSMGLREWRQVMIAFGKYHLHRFSEFSAIKDHIERYMAHQAGHSVSTHRNMYAHLKGAVCEGDMQSFMVASFAFLWLLKLSVPSVGKTLVPAFGVCIMTEPAFVTAPELTTDGHVEMVCSGRTGHHLPYIEDHFYSSASARLKDRYGVSKFKSRLQQHAIAAAIKGEEFLYVAPCGTGKRNLKLMGFKPQMCAVCIVPYGILRKQITVAAESCGLKTLNYCEQTKHSFNASNPPDLIVISYEQIPSISTMLYELGSRLQRIILDEIQICFSEEFRLIVGQYKRWRSWLFFNAPIIYLSGSFPPAWEEHFQSAFGAPSAHVPIVRESVVRENVQLEFKMNDSWRDMYNVMAALSSELQKSKVAKTMIFVMHRRQCNTVKDFLMSPSSPHSQRQIFTYWSGHADEDQIELIGQFEGFKRSEAGIIICTHAGAIGADIAGVSDVYHLEGAHSLVSYFQATGRCGRDGSKGKARFLSNARLIQQSTQDPSILELATTKECKRLARFLAPHL